MSSIPNDFWFNAIPSEARTRLTVQQIRAINVVSVGLRSLTVEQIGFLSIEQIQSLEFGNFKYLTANEVVDLTPAQIASIPSTGALNAIPVAARAALSEEQIQAFDTSDIAIALLTPAQIGFLTPEQIQSIDFTQFKHLGPEEIIYLTSTQMATIPSVGWLNGIPAAARAALTRTQIQALNVNLLGLTKLTTEQIGFLLPSQVESLFRAEFQRLGPNEIIHLTPAQLTTISDAASFNAIPSASRAALTRPQVQALDVLSVGLHLLTKQQIGYLSGAQIQSLNHTQFRYLGPDEIVLLTPTQVAEIPTVEWLNSIPASSRAALTRSQIQALKVNRLGLSKLTSEQIGFLLPTQITSLYLSEFKHLGPNEIVHLMPVQLAMIKDTAVFNAIPSASRAALTQSQVQGLDVASVGLRSLTEQQIGYLSRDQIQSVDHTQFQYLGPHEIVLLTSAQIASIPSVEWLDTISGTSRAAFTPSQIQSLNVYLLGLSKLTSEQIRYLLPFQIISLRLPDIRYLGPDEIVDLTPAHIAALAETASFNAIPSAARAALTEVQVRALNVAAIGVSLLTEQQIAYLTPDQIQSIDVTQFRHLGPGEIVELTPSQIVAIPDTGTLNAIPNASRAALTALQVRALDAASVGLHLLTEQQIRYLSRNQIQSVDYTQFKFLGSDEIVFLTPAQVASIPNVEWLNGIPAASRAALTRPQIRALNVRILGLSKLTSKQIGYLLPSQIVSLHHTEIKNLGPDKIIHLSPAQIAAIPDTASFNAIPSASRVALTRPQVQALDVAAIEVASLTARQFAYLSPAQVAQLDHWELGRLTPSQVPFITTAQIASTPSVAFFRQLSVEAQLSLTREQLLSMRPHVLAEFNRMHTDLAAPSDFADPLAIRPASDGLAGDQRTLKEANAIFELVPREAATHVTVSSGNWTDAAIWAEDKVPGPGADVLILGGHTVVFDALMTEPIHTLRIDGVLRFAPDRDTAMLVDTVIVDTFGVLHIGTQEQPIAAGVTARMMFTAGAIDTTWDPQLISRGLSSRGQVRVYGQEVTPYVETLTAPRVSDRQLILNQVPVNWKVGDQLIVAGTKDFGGHDEQREILSIIGNTVTVAPLRYNHVPPEGFGFSVHVANVTRNVVFESENPDTIAERGHLMFAHNTNVEIVNAGMYGLGRTDKSIPVNDPVVISGVLQGGTGLNRRARYPIHFHRTGVDATKAPAIVRGNAVVGSPGWGYVNHSSFVIMEENVAYDVVGAAFASEDGNEIGAFRRNLAIRGAGSGQYVLSRTAIHDFGHGGHGFWIQGPGVEVIDNIAAGQSDTAFVFFTASSQNLFNAINLNHPSLAAGNQLVPVGGVPLKEVSGNVAYGSYRGLDTWYHQMNMPDGPTVIDGFTAWNTIRGGVKAFYTGQLILRDLLIVGDTDSPNGTGVEVNRDSHDIQVEYARLQGLSVGIEASQRGATTIRGGQFSTVVGVRVSRAENRFRMVEITQSPTFAELPAVQLEGRTQYEVFVDINSAELAENLHTYLRPLVHLYGTIIVDGQQYYHANQAHNFIPLSLSSAVSYLPYEMIYKTNQQLWESFGVAVGGQPAPADAVAASRINGLLGSPIDAPISRSMVSPRFPVQRTGYRLEYLDQYGDVVQELETVNLKKGWNLFVRQIDGQTTSFFVFGPLAS